MAEHKINAGDLVEVAQLAGPRMIVDAVHPTTQRVTCIWFDKGQLQTAELSSTVLKVIGQPVPVADTGDDDDEPQPGKWDSITQG